MATHLFYLRMCAVLPLCLIWRILAWAYPSPYNDRRRHFVTFWANNCNTWHIAFGISAYTFCGGVLHAAAALV